MGTSWLGAAGAERGQSRQAACSGLDVPGYGRVKRENCAETQVSALEGKWGEGGFLEKGQDSCGGLATPPVGGCVHWVLQSDGVWWRAHLVRRRLARGPWSSWGVWRLGAATQRAEVAWDWERPGQSKEDPRGRSLSCAVLGEAGRSRARSQLAVASWVCARAVRWAGIAGRAGPPGEADSGLWLAPVGCGSCASSSAGRAGQLRPPCTDECACTGAIGGLAGTNIGSPAGAPPVVLTMTSRQSFHSVALKAYLLSWRARVQNLVSRCEL